MATYSAIIEKCKKDWNCKDLMKPKRGRKIPFSSPLLNYATYGGIPRGGITEFFGVPGGGKSTTAIDICKNAHVIFSEEYQEEVAALQEQLVSGTKEEKRSAEIQLEELSEHGAKKVLYVDLEHSMDNDWAAKLGIRPEEIDVMRPPDTIAESLLQAVQELIESGEVGLIVLDSVPSLVTKAELEKKFGERTVSSLAGLLTIFFRKIVPLLTRYDATLLLINQIRDNMDNPYVVNTPGGQALKFYASLRIMFKIDVPIDFLGNKLPASSENPAGYIITAKIVKQKSAPWDRKNASYHLLSQSGIRVDMDFCKLAVEKYGIIRKSGAWFYPYDPETREPVQDSNGKEVKLNGMVKVFEYVQTNTDYYNRLKTFIINDIEKSGIDNVSE